MNARLQDMLQVGYLLSDRDLYRLLTRNGNRGLILKPEKAVYFLVLSTAAQADLDYWLAGGRLHE